MGDSSKGPSNTKGVSGKELTMLLKKSVVDCISSDSSRPGGGYLHIAVGVGAPVDSAVNICSSLVIVREYFGVICIAPDGL